MQRLLIAGLVAAAAGAVEPSAGSVVEPWTERRLQAYEPVYFALGGHEVVNAKFQLAFRYLITERLQASYTQTSLWDLEDESKPFYDTSYKPRVFWREDRFAKPAWIADLALEAGLGHESNGQADPLSRSMNIAFVRPDVRFTLADPWRLRLYPMAVAYLEKSENPDIAAYRGHVEWVAGVERGHWGGLSVISRLGNGWQHASIETQYTYPLGQWLGGGESPFLFVQWFNGYGESLLDYNQRTPWQIRLGFAIVR
jgi:outer membrane phospholipase A